MKQVIGFSFLLLASLSVSAVAVDTPTSISKCRVTANDVTNGNLLVQSESLVRFEKADLIELNLSREMRYFRLKIFEVQTSPDSFEYDVEVTDLPRGLYFNKSGTTALGGAFGNANLFGTVACEFPKAVAFYYSSNAGKILLEETRIRETLYDMITQPGACVGGNLALAAKDMARYWYMPIEGDVKVVGNGLEWLELKRKCVKWDERDYDLPGPSCLQWEEISRRNVRVEACKN